MKAWHRHSVSFYHGGGLLILLMVVVQAQVHTTSSTTYVITTSVGNIQGHLVPDMQGNEHFSFTGIPYAKPPTGNLRFAKPQPHTKFETTFDATKRGPICPQVASMMYHAKGEDEDCLTLNVYVKDVANVKTQKKVFAYIHGGAFIIGEAVNYKFGSFVNDHDVIVVTFNYRIGILGFLSSGNEASPGNFGLWDQQLALEWIRENIEYFGGDPSDVTIGGESAGGASATFLALSPRPKGLFNKVYAHSGTSTGPFAVAPKAQMDMLAFAQANGCWQGNPTQAIDLDESKVVIKCLRNLNISAFQSYPLIPAGTPAFVPVVDGDFLPQMPLDLLKDTQYLDSIGFFDMSFLIAFNNQERAFIHNHNTAFENFMMANSDMSEQEKAAAIEFWKNSIWQNYISYRMPSATPDLSDRVKTWYDRRYGNMGLTNIINDLAFVVSSYDILNAASQRKETDAWFLYFDYFPSFMKGKDRGTMHGVDCTFLLDAPLEMAEKLLRAGIQGEMNSDDKELKRSFSVLIADFVKHGNPSKSLKLPKGWPKYDIQDAYYLKFDLKPRALTHLMYENSDFWLHDVHKLASDAVAGTEEAVDSNQKHTEL